MVIVPGWSGDLNRLRDDDHELWRMQSKSDPNDAQDGHRVRRMRGHHPRGHSQMGLRGLLLA
eukprot:2184304-Pyramimonas_sp.AAC.1